MSTEQIMLAVMITMMTGVMAGVFTMCVYVYRQGRLASQIESISEQLVEIKQTLTRMENTLHNIDKRVVVLEDRQTRQPDDGQQRRLAIT